MHQLFTSGTRRPRRWLAGRCRKNKDGVWTVFLAWSCLVVFKCNMCAARRKVSSKKYVINISIIWRFHRHVNSKERLVWKTCFLRENFGALIRVRDRFEIYWQNNDLLHPKTMIHNVKDRNSIDSHYKISTA